MAFQFSQFSSVSPFSFLAGGRMPPVPPFSSVSSVSQFSQFSQFSGRWQNAAGAGDPALGLRWRSAALALEILRSACARARLRSSWSEAALALRIPALALGCARAPLRSRSAALRGEHRILRSRSAALALTCARARLRSDNLGWGGGSGDSVRFGGLGGLGGVWGLAIQYRGIISGC